MKGQNFNKIIKLFDYFKQAYRINILHKELYKPQVMLILLKGLFTFLTIASFVQLSKNMIHLTGLDFSKFFKVFMGEFLGLPFIIILGALIITLFGSTYVESGLYSMYHTFVADTRNDKDFITLANKYFPRFLFGNILIILFWILAIIPYFILGAVSLSIGFSLIPIIVSAFLMVWKVAIVSKNIATIDAIKESVGFCKRHFIPSITLMILSRGLTTLNSGSSSGASWQNSYSNIGQLGDQPSLETMPSNGFNGNFFDSNVDVSRIVEIALYASATIFAIMTILYGLIHMIFDIFFGLVFTCVYVDNWGQRDDIPIDDPVEIIGGEINDTI